MKKKKPYRYVKLEDNATDYGFFPATKARKEFRLPWRVKGKGLKEKLV